MLFERTFNRLLGMCIILIILAIGQSVSAATTHSLTVSLIGTGNGIVSSDPSGIDCGTDCAEEFDEGTAVTLTATPAEDSIFAGWAEGSCSGKGKCYISMFSDKIATAEFIQGSYSVDIIDDFEGEFANQGSYGQIPTGWSSSSRSNTVQYSKGNEVYNGSFGLHADATWDPNYYGFIIKNDFNTGFSNETVHFSIRVKAQTSSQCSFTLLVYSGGITVESNLFWYSNTETGWRTAEFDFEVPSSGIVEDIVLIFGHDSPSGSSTFDVDYLTVGCFEAFYYRDIDGDGFGDPSDTTQTCGQPEGYVLNNSDLCDEDPDKQEPGLCGCGISDSVTDSDNDEIIDCIEDANHNGIVDPDETDPNNPDTDNDGVNDGLEVNILGTNPLDPNDGDIDTDGDGFSNAEEVQCETDPVDPDSKCRRVLPFLMLLLD